jgi:membrane protein YqaA with SNARE-associated domain
MIPPTATSPKQPIAATTSQIAFELEARTGAADIGVGGVGGTGGSSNSCLWQEGQTPCGVARRAPQWGQFVIFDLVVGVDILPRSGKIDLAEDSATTGRTREERMTKDRARAPWSERAAMGGASLWGFLEATLFFIVPDVLLSTLALRSGRLALRAALATVAGALLGGALMWTLGSERPGDAAQLVATVPAISWSALAEVRAQLTRDGWRALLVGGFVGTPYKIFAMEAGRLGLPLVELLAFTVPARLARFLAVSGLAGLGGALLGRWGVSLARRRQVLWTVWVLNYLVYWTLKDW